MRDVIDSFAIANAVRMIRTARAGSLAVLIEREADVRRVGNLADQYDFYIVPTYNSENLVGAIEILSRDNWGVTCTPLRRSRAMPRNIPAPLQRLPWVNSMLEGITASGQDLQYGSHCVAVISTGKKESLKQSRMPFEDERLGGDWTVKNKRRISLIKKQTREGLTPEEEADLNNLQVETRSRLNAVYPLPFNELKKLEEYVNDAERHLVEDK
ncbi:MAG: hypothetical protein M3362_01175 [Acidobacteriota bacterium]|nr:hypothetical protein [Acidobacteriota bacterium]